MSGRQRKLRERFCGRAQPLDETLRAQWLEDIIHGNLNSLRHLMRKFQLSPDYPVNHLGETPLKALLMVESNPKAQTRQILIAEHLIASGAELRMHDKYFLLPADYAMLSGNTEAAKLVILKTIEQNKKRGLDYIPYLEPYFAAIIHADEAYKSFEKYRNNHNSCREFFLTEGSSALKSMSHEELDYWTSPFNQRLADMPAASRELAEAYEACMKSAQAAGETINGSIMLNVDDLEDIEADYYNAEITHILDLRRQRDFGPS